MGESRDTSARVSFRDVGELSRAIGRQYGGDVSCELVFDVPTTGNVHFFVRAWFRPRSVGVRTVRAQRAVSSPWPTASAATVAGLMFRLVYDLDRELGDAEPVEVASEQVRLW